MLGGGTAKVCVLLPNAFQSKRLGELHTVRIGINSFVWESPFSSESLGLIEKAANMGFDTFEIAVENPDLIPVDELHAALRRTGMQAVVCGVFGPGRDLSSEDPDVRRATQEYITFCIDMARQLGASVVCGPMYASVGKARLLSEAERRREWERSVESMRTLARYAGDHGVRLAIEPLNRFETDMINTTEQALAYVNDVGHPNIGLHLDTFHMHLEERDSAEAIRRAGDRLFHFHACENDRGVPGRGQVNWTAIAEALRNSGYNGAIVIESFTPEVQSIARAACIWRPVAPDQDTIAREGLAFLKRLFGDELSAYGEQVG